MGVPVGVVLVLSTLDLRGPDRGVMLLLSKEDTGVGAGVGPSSL